MDNTAPGSARWSFADLICAKLGTKRALIFTVLSNTCSVHIFEDLVRTCIHQICAALGSFAKYFRRSGMSTWCTRGTAGLAEASGVQSRKRKRGTRQRTKETTSKNIGNNKTKTQISKYCRSKIVHTNRYEAMRVKAVGSPANVFVFVGLEAWLSRR